MTTTTRIASEKSPEYLPVAPEPASAEASRRVSLFRNGANQAVRIPKEFELPGKEAILRREGNRLVLEAMPDKPKKGTAAALAAALESMKDWPIVDEPFPDVNEGLLPLDDVEL
jgi:antitoxin VapB